MEEKKLFLLDAYALIYRAYYALISSPRFTAGGINTSAIFGFCNTLDEVLRKENPTHIAVCFDPPGPTFRHDEYAEYKAGRDKQPEDITVALPIIKEILAAYRIPVVEIPRYEADDVIGTLSRHATDGGYTTYMMTPDKDYGQLVNDHVLMYRPSLRGVGFEIRGPKEVCARYGISTPDQVIDLLALEGDTSDNIPGCPGVGEKTAVKLIGQWGNVENMLAHADDIPGALGRKIRDNSQQIRFSRQLVTIKTDVPVDIRIEDLRRQEPDVKALTEIFQRLEFKTLIARLHRNTVQPDLFAAPAVPMAESPDLPAPTQIEGHYTVADNATDVSQAVSEAMKHDMVGISVVALGDDATQATVKGLAMSWAEGQGVWVPLEGNDDLFAAQETTAMLQPLLCAAHITLVSPDIKRDIVALNTIGLTLPAQYYDVTLAQYLLQPEQSHDLPDIAMTYLRRTMSIYGTNARNRTPWAKLTPQGMMQRACEFADVARCLVAPLTKALAEAGQYELAREIEFPTARVLAAMETAGVRIDTHALAEMSVQMTRHLAQLQAQADELAGGPINVGSPAQVGEVLFGRLGLDPKARRTKTGAFSTTEEVLEKHRHDHPLVALILEIRGVKKLLNTYVNALPTYISRCDGKVHTTFQQTVTATGRISSTNPNLQNIPIRTDEGREIRRCVVADPGCQILSADYSQIELRLIADLAQDENMIEAFRSGRDIHRATAAKVFHIDPEQVDDNQRRHAKTVNFGIIYGISAFGISQRLDIPRAEAKALIEGYFAAYPAIRRYIDRVVEEARRDGYVSTLNHRRRYLPDISSRSAAVRGYAERNAVNAPLQGSAADIIKIAMIRTLRRMREDGLRSQMILQVHDELVFNVVDGEMERMQAIVKECMEGAYTQGRVSLQVSMGHGPNWLDAH